MTTSCRRVWWVATVGIVGFLLQVSPAAAEEAVPRITIGLERAFDPELPDLLTSRLSDPDGNPINSEEVEFWVAVDVMGDRFAFVGSGVTDAAGVARLPFIPHKDAYEVRATFDGDEVWASAEGVATVAFDPGRVDRYAPAAVTQLGQLKYVMPRVMGVVVALIWAALFALTYFTLRSFRRQGKQAST